MKIQGNEAAKINEMLKESLQQGDRYVSLESNGTGKYFRADSMEYFGTKSGVKLYNSITDTIDGKYREALPVLPLQEQLQRKIDLQMTRAPGSELKDIVIDTGIIHYQEQARSEISTEEISRQLRERDIRPDIKQLQEHIGRDDQQFIIEGARAEKGSERLYKIHVEQNEHRAFLIKDIVSQPAIHQQRKMSVVLVMAYFFTNLDSCCLLNICTPLAILAINEGNLFLYPRNTA